MKSVLMAHLVSLPFILLTVTIVLVTMTTQQARGQLLQGSLAGNVTDSSQAAVADAQVVATDQATSLSRQTITNSAGAYTMPVLPPGNYNVTVRSPGFQMVYADRGGGNSADGDACGRRAGGGGGD